MKTRNNPWAALDAMMKTEPEPTGPGWFTVQDFLNRYGKGRTYTWAAQNLRAMHVAGKVEKWVGSSAGRNGKLLKYKIKP
jgi:hypothetical protein